MIEYNARKKSCFDTKINPWSNKSPDRTMPKIMARLNSGAGVTKVQGFEKLPTGFLVNMSAR